ncbi:unnamed protein product [Meganyctiphanes norvegica]|uniref:Serine/threonine-protein phosphatase CPPED1 n=1 Tax=Meganyctiphanes norvegica TaxID=48144 RepID=A0AAV2RUT2_MEGNR
MNNLLPICIIFSLVHCYICAPFSAGNSGEAISQCTIDTSYISSPGDFKITTKDRKYLPFDENCEKSWKDPFTFVQAADTQFGMQEKYVEKITENYGWSKEIEWSTQLVADVNGLSPRPKFLVVCGDLMDAWPKTEPEIRKRQMVDFKRIFTGLEVPLVCVCGNHDIGNTPNNETIISYKKDIGDDYFSFWANGVFFIVINSQFFKDATESKELAAEHEEWLEAQLEVVRTEKPKHAVVFQHIPLFLASPDEDDDYFNFEKVLRIETLERFHDAGIRYVFTGHYHRNAGGFYKDLEVVVTSAAGVQLGDDDPGYRIVKVFKDKMEHAYYNLGEAPREISFTASSTKAIPDSNNEKSASALVVPSLGTYSFCIISIYTIIFS